MYCFDLTVASSIRPGLTKAFVILTTPSGLRSEITVGTQYKLCTKLTNCRQLFLIGGSSWMPVRCYGLLYLFIIADAYIWKWDFYTHRIGNVLYFLQYNLIVGVRRFIWSRVAGWSHAHGDAILKARRVWCLNGRDEVGVGPSMPLI
jgi:hypothetical protein